MTDLMELIRRRSGTVAAASAVVGLVLGAFGAYGVVRHTQSEPQILLRQATESDPMASYDDIPGADGVLVLVRNDSSTAVEVIDAAFSRTSAAPPLYISPDTVQPGAEVDVYVPVPAACLAPPPQPANPPAPPVRILVSAHLPGEPIESVPVEVVGQLAQYLAACRGGSS